MDAPLPAVHKQCVRKKTALCVQPQASSEGERTDLSALGRQLSELLVLYVLV